jgi:amino acid transporter
MTGYESVTKAAEEANPEFRSRGYFRAIWAAIIVGFVFYIIVIGAVSYVAPWHQLTSKPFMTAVAFEQAIGSRWIVSIILAAALLSLFKVFNGNLGLPPAASCSPWDAVALHRSALMQIHPVNQTPALAVIWVGIATCVCMFLGTAILVPISEVGSVASATGWTAACLAYLWMQPSKRDRAIAIIGATVGFLMILMKIVPIPGHFDRWEWIALAAWVALGLALRRRSTPAS